MPLECERFLVLRGGNLKLSSKQTVVLRHLKKTWNPGQWFNGLHGTNTSEFSRIEPTLHALCRKGLLEKRWRPALALVKESLYEFRLVKKSRQSNHPA